MNELEFTGLWWYPDSPEQQAAGTLKYSSEEGGVLTVIGAIDDVFAMSAFSDHPVIHGLANNKFITLYKPFVEQVSSNYPGPHSQRIRADQFFEGAHLLVDDLQFNKASVSTSQLPEFVWDTSISKTMHFDKEFKTMKKTVIKVVTKKAVDIGKVAGAKLVLGRGWSQNDVNFRSSTVNERVLVDFEFESRTPLSRIIEEYIRPLQNLVTLGTDSANKIETLSLRASKLKDQTGREARILYHYRQFANVRNSQRTFRDDNMLFRLKDVKGAKLSKWFAMHEKYEPVMAIVFGLRYFSSINVENQLMNAVSATEAYHRRRFKNNIASRTIWAKRIERITKPLNQQDEAFIKEALQFSNEKRLKQRIDEIVNYSGLGDIFVEDLEKWNSRVRRHRNALTHYDPRSKKDTSNHEMMYHLSNSITWILLACMMRDTGFSRDSIQKIFLKNQTYLHHRDRLNSLLNPADPLS